MVMVTVVVRIISELVPLPFYFGAETVPFAVENSCSKNCILANLQFKTQAFDFKSLSELLCSKLKKTLCTNLSPLALGGA